MYNVYFGVDKLDKKMTVKQAFRWGQKTIPKDLKNSGFKTIVFKSSIEIHGAEYLRVSFGK